ncbi:MAG: MOSC domain-containing protein [Alphaproteobacteria bacterium]
MSQIRLESVNVGQPVALDAGRPDKRTGICKRAVEGAVRVDRLGAEGDVVVDARHHGGPGQALYLYSLEDYAFWSAQGVATGSGMFGENLTVSGIESADLCIGDRLVVGEVVLEVTSSRIPCATFASAWAIRGSSKNSAMRGVQGLIFGLSRWVISRRGRRSSCSRSPGTGFRWGNTSP